MVAEAEAEAAVAAAAVAAAVAEEAIQLTSPLTHLATVAACRVAAPDQRVTFCDGHVMLRDAK